MPSKYTCDFNGCKRSATIATMDVEDGAVQSPAAAYYCSDFHAGIALIQKWAANTKSGTTIKRLYKTASGLLDKLAKAVEKEWANTATEKPSANG